MADRSHLESCHTVFRRHSKLTANDQSWSMHQILARPTPQCPPSAPRKPSISPDFTPRFALKTPDSRAALDSAWPRRSTLDTSDNISSGCLIPFRHPPRRRKRSNCAWAGLIRPLSSSQANASMANATLAKTPGWRLTWSRREAPLPEAPAGALGGDVWPRDTPEHWLIPSGYSAVATRRFLSRSVMGEVRCALHPC